MPVFSIRWEIRRSLQIVFFPDANLFLTTLSVYRWVRNDSYEYQHPSFLRGPSSLLLRGSWSGREMKD